MTPINLRIGWDITGHLDGYALWFKGELVDVFPTFDGAVEGRRWARGANAMLSGEQAQQDLSTLSCGELDKHIKSLIQEDIEALLAEQEEQL